MKSFGGINFSDYSDDDLRSALGTIKKDKYPLNYDALLKEIEGRKASGSWAKTAADSELSQKSETSVLAVKTNRQTDSLIIEIKNKDPMTAFFFIFGIIFFTLWFCGVFAASANAISDFINDGTFTLILLLPFVGIFIFLGFTFALFFTQFGREVLVFNKGHIALKYMFGSRTVWTTTVPIKSLEGLRRHYERLSRKGGHRFVPIIQLIAYDKTVSFARYCTRKEYADIKESILKFGIDNGFNWEGLEQSKERAPSVVEYVLSVVAVIAIFVLIWAIL